MYVLLYIPVLAQRLVRGQQAVAVWTLLYCYGSIGIQDYFAEDRAENRLGDGSRRSGPVLEFRTIVVGIGHWIHASWSGASVQRQISGEAHWDFFLEIKTKNETKGLLPCFNTRLLTPGARPATAAAAAPRSQATSPMPRNRAKPRETQAQQRPPPRNPRQNHGPNGGRRRPREEVGANVSAGEQEIDCTTGDTSLCRRDQARRSELGTGLSK